MALSPTELTDLSGVLLPIALAETGPLAEGLVVADLEHRDGVLAGERLDQLDVVSFVAVLGQEAKYMLEMIKDEKNEPDDGVSSLKSSDGLVQSSGESVLEVALLEDFLNGGLDGETSGSDWSGGGGWGNFSFRHLVSSMTV